MPSSSSNSNNQQQQPPLFKPYRNQDYKHLKSECLKSGQLFEDDQFPANHYSISRKSVINERIVWKRPFQIVDDPKFIVDGLKPSNFDQGQLPNW
jgi:hypothetical protein